MKTIAFTIGLILLPVTSSATFAATTAAIASNRQDSPAVELRWPFIPQTDNSAKPDAILDHKADDQLNKPLPSADCRYGSRGNLAAVDVNGLAAAMIPVAYLTRATTSDGKPNQRQAKCRQGLYQQLSPLNPARTTGRSWVF